MKSSALVTRSWNGHAIQRRRADGYVNATAMCRAGRKHLPHYMATLRGREYLQALEGSVGIPTHLLAQTVVTGPNAGRGTWVHPRLAVDLARWISPEFAVWMDGWILEELEARAKPSQLDLAVTTDDAAAMIGLGCAQIGDSLKRVAALMGHPPTATTDTIAIAVECMEDSKRLLAMVDRLMRTIPAADINRRRLA